MFNRDYNGLTSEPINSHIPGGVSPTRQALMGQLYLDEKRTRLEAEAAEQQRQKINGFKQRMAVVCARLVKATYTAFKVSKLRLSNVSRKA